jgi:hypothetical protein
MLRFFTYHDKYEDSNGKVKSTDYPHGEFYDGEKYFVASYLMRDDGVLVIKEYGDCGKSSLIAELLTSCDMKAIDWWVKVRKSFASEPASRQFRNRTAIPAALVPPMASLAADNGDRLSNTTADAEGDGRSPLLPERRGGDLFICDILDAAPKGDMASMEHPLRSSWAPRCCAGGRQIP